MPIYEFRCEACGAELEALVGPGGEPIVCVECGSSELRRVYSPQAAPQRLVKSAGATREQERRNASLRDTTKARFAQARARARARATGRADGER